jgi:hypothetical protein
MMTSVRVRTTTPFWAMGGLLSRNARLAVFLDRLETQTPLGTERLSGRPGPFSARLELLVEAGQLARVEAFPCRRPGAALYAQIVTCEHQFVTSQGSAYGRLRRALDTGNTPIALAAAAELDFVSLPDALELVLLLVDEPARFRRAARRWHARYCGDLPDVGFEEAHAVLAGLAGLTGRRPKPAAAALAELVHRRGLERASEALMRWAG